jgi:TonB-linked SusC/RagA family outer membrane protein
VVGSQTQIDVILVEDITALGEVVVVGYGTQRRSDLTGAITSVSPKELTQLPLARADQAIQGRTSGVYVLNSDASPGGETIIRIRGLNSINGGNQPLVVLDGLQGGEPLLRTVNPQDVESIEILKDASATAIYGSRGANGVILITTKLGKLGKPVIDANVSVGIQSLARKLPVMSAAQFANYHNAMAATNTGGGNVPILPFTDAQIAEFESPSYGFGTDWQDVIYETGVLQNYNLGVSGGTDKLKYNVSTNYLDHKGILKGSAYDRISLRTNVAADITDWVDFGLNYMFTKETYKSPAFRRREGISFTAQAINVAPRWAATEPVYKEDGTLNLFHNPQYGANDTWNPLASATEPKMDRPTYRNNVNLFLNFDIVKGLSLKITGGAIFTNAKERDYYNLNTNEGYANNGAANLRDNNWENYQNSNILTYTNTFADKHQLTVTGVVEQLYSKWYETTTTARNFIVDQLGYNNIGGAQFLSIGSWAGERALLSYLGRVNYVFADKYLATFSYRADGSSVFGEDNKWGYFPSASVAWRISEENFLTGSSVVTELKLRGSWGKTGNQAIDPYQSLARLYSEPGDWGPDYPYNGISPTNTGFAIGGLANPNLKWETTTQTDIGMDLSLFNGRLTSTIDVYKKVTDDLLMDRELPGYIGISSIIDNIGSIENKGLEILIGGDPIVGDVRWNTSFNITANRNKVVDLGPDERLSYSASFGGYSLSNDFMILEVGQPYGTMLGWEFLGIWGTDEAEDAERYGQLPGDIHIRDVDDDGDVDLDDRVIIGNGYPNFTWGWSNLLTFKNLELSFLFMGMQGVDLFNQLRIRRESYEANDPRVLNYWTPENQDTDQPGLIDGAYRESQNLTSTVYVPGSGRGGEVSKWVEDASFIRLKVITLAYNFDRSILSKIGFNKIRVYFTGTNLWTITGYTGYDPEVANFTEQDATIGVDLSAYPPARMYTFGLDLTF